MATSLQFTLSNPTPGKEAEYNEWYGEHHLFTGVLTPGVLAGQRFKRVPGPWPEGKHDYMVVWEFDDPAYALEQLALVKGTAAMPLSDAIDMNGIQPPTMWLRAGVRSGARLATDSAQRKSCVLMLANAEEGREAAFEAGVLGGGLAGLADRPGVLSADFLTLADEQIRGNARKYRYALLIELADEAAGLESLTSRLAGLPHLAVGRWLAPVYRPVGPRVTTLEARARQAAP
jgi:hypothetical protein